MAKERRGHRYHVTIVATVAVLDLDRHPFAVDI
jgi:hypothetical protein